MVLNENNQRHLLITVHGIRTFGQWQERLAKLLSAHSIEVRHFKFGYFFFAYLIPPLRWLAVRRFRKALLTVTKETQWDRIDIVAHSFGTHLVAWGLYGLPSDKRPEIHTIILASSVLRDNFPWSDLMGAGKVGYLTRVVNECAIRDTVLVANQIVVFLSGSAGRTGFTGFEDEMRLVNRYFDFGHSGYFFSKNTQPYDDFMRDKWVPLLTSDSRPERFDARTGPNPFQRFILVLLRAFNIEPLKVFANLVCTCLIISQTPFFAYEDPRSYFRAETWVEHKVMLDTGKEYRLPKGALWTDIDCVGQECWLSGLLQGGGSSSMRTVCGSGVVLHSNDRTIQWKEVEKEKFNSGKGGFAPPFTNWSWEEIGPIEAMQFYPWKLPDKPLTVWGWLAGCSGIYQTLDAGQHWQRITPSPDQPSAFGLYRSIDVFEGVSGIYAAGWQGIIHSSYPHTPQSWEIQKRTYSYAIFTVFVGPWRETWAVGQAPEENSEHKNEYYGGVYRLSAGGRTWERLYRTNHPGEQLSGIHVYENTAIVAGSKGLILRGTRDEKSGNWSWSNVASGVESLLTSVAYAEKSGYWIVGDKGVILFSVDDGKTWRRISAQDRDGRPIQSSLGRIRFRGDMGWIVGHGILLCAQNEFNRFCGEARP